MTCRLEKQLRSILETSGIEFTLPERDPDDPTNLDFYLPDFRLYIEVKQFHTSRLSDQLAKVPERTTAIVLQGPGAVLDFERLCRAIRR